MPTLKILLLFNYLKIYRDLKICKFVQLSANVALMLTLWDISIKLALLKNEKRVSFTLAHYCIVETIGACVGSNFKVFGGITMIKLKILNSMTILKLSLKIVHYDFCKACMFNIAIILLIIIL